MINECWAIYLENYLSGENMKFGEKHHLGMTRNLVQWNSMGKLAKRAMNGHGQCSYEQNAV